MRDWFAGFPKPAPAKTIDPVTLTAWSAFGLFLLALLALMYVAHALLVPAVAAAVTAIIFSPVARWLERRGIPSGISALLVITGFVLALAAGGAAVVPTARTLGAQLPEMAARIEFKLVDIRATLKSMREVREKLNKATEVGETPNPKVEVSRNDGGGLAQFAFQLGFFAVLTYFLLAARLDYKRRLILAQPSQADRLRTARILRDMGKRVSSYLFTVTMINVGLGFVTAVALVAIGLPFAVLLGFAIALLNFLPFIGPILVIALTALLSLATFDDWGLALAGPGIVLLLHLIESQFVSPWLIGRRLEISPVAVFVGIAVLGWMWGAVGAMVAVPLLILLYTFGQRIPALSPLASMIGPTEGESDDDDKDADAVEAEANAEAKAEAREILPTNPAAALDPGAPTEPRARANVS